MSEAAAATVPTVTPSDRLSFTAFLALVLHVALITGIGFAMPDPVATPPSLEIILAQRSQEPEPEEADFLAQANQQGSGTLQEKKTPTTDQVAEYQDAELRETVAPEAPPPVPEQRRPERQPVTTPTPAPDRIAVSQDAEERPEPDRPDSQEMLRRSLEIASLEARFEMQRQEYARNPKILRLTSASTRKTRDAWYLEAWRRKVEMVGNLNYPEEARRNRIYGSLRLMVSLLPDGHVKEVRVLESSGHRVLDDAAIRIVRLAQPFAPFPKEMREEVDIIEIIRTWKFARTLSSF